jgi:hypothetical protein
MTEAQNKVWRDRGLPDGAAYAVGAKVLSCHACLCLSPGPSTAQGPEGANCKKPGKR